MDPSIFDNYFSVGFVDVCDQSLRDGLVDRSHIQLLDYESTRLICSLVRLRVALPFSCTTEVLIVHTYSYSVRNRHDKFVHFVFVHLFMCELRLFSTVVIQYTQCVKTSTL